MCTIMLLLRANSSRHFLTSLVSAYYTPNLLVTFIWLVVIIKQLAFPMHVRVTATAVRLRRPICASKKLTLDPECSVTWWTSHIKGGMFTRRSPQFAQADQLDKILVHAGNNQLSQDLEER